MQKNMKKLLKTALELVEKQQEVILKAISEDAKAEEIEQERMAENGQEHDAEMAAERAAEDAVDRNIDTYKEEKVQSPKDEVGFYPR